MKSRERYVKWIAVALSLVVAFVLIGMCGLAFLYQRQLDQARAQYAPPTVYVSQPLSGSSAPAGSQLAVSATAWGEVPITRAELWLSGQLVDTQESDLPEGVSPFHAHFGLLVFEGPQQLVVRAVSAEGIIGQSVPIGVTGEAAVDEGLVAVVVDPGQTLEDVAAAHDIEPEAVRELNPGLGDQEPPQGTEVIVPAPPAPAPPGPQGPPVGPAIPPSPGTPPVTGTVPMPPGVLPLTPILPGPNMTGTVTGTVPLPIIVGTLLPQLAVPVFTPPAAPTNLQGVVEDCLIRLRWQDNTANELRYDVWTAPQAGSPRLIASLAPAKGGAAWFEFPAPLTGGLSFWVEAVGLGGKQPSNIVWLEVNPQCPTTSPTRLQVEALDMSIRGGYDKAYCYVSFENIPEERLPHDDSAFIQVQGGQGNIATWASGNKKLLVPIPADGALDLVGECWAWAGEALDKLGDFSDTTNSSQWTGTRLPLLAEGYEIGYAVTYAGEASGEGEETTYAYEDPSVPSPYNLTMLGKSSPGVPGSSWTALHWDWNGDEKTITGFAVFLDGQPYATIFGADKRGIGVNPPTGCDKRQRWQVAAVAGEAQSRLSAVYEYRTPECPVSVEVVFEEIEVKCVDTSWFNPVCPSCDTVECWFRVFANDQSAQRFSFNFPMKLSCQTWKINWAGWPDPPQNTLTVQIGPSDTSLQFGSRWFYQNSFGELAKFQEASRTITMSLDQWRTYQGEHRLCPGKQAGVMSCLLVKIRGPEVSVL
jgi:hypothetical protein